MPYSLIAYPFITLAAQLFKQTPPPPILPASSTSSTPTISEIIVLLINGEFGTAFTLLIKFYAWWGVLVIAGLIALMLAWWLWGPDGAGHRNWLRGIWHGLRRMPPEEDTQAVDVPTVETLLQPLGPYEEKRFVEVKLSLPPKGEQQVYAETGITYNSLGEALNASNPETGQLFARLVLLGDPGAGKTWLLRKLAQEVVQLCRQDPSAPVPLLASLSNHRFGSPVEFLRSQWPRFWQEIPHGLTFDQAFNQGRLLLLADGLNEINRKQYQSLLTQWRRFLYDNFSPDGNRVIIACRLEDFNSALPSSLIPRLVVRPLEPRRIQEYLHNRIPDSADRVWDEIEKDEKEGRKDLIRLAENPFWLDKLAALAETGDLPHSRAQLAKEFIQCRLDEEHGKHPELSLVDSGWEPYLDAMSWLAWKGLWRSSDYKYPKEEALHILASCPMLAAGQANILLDRMTSGQILKKVVGGIKFHHQLFQEYFAARQLAKSYQGIGKPNNRLHQWWLEYRLWRTPWGRVNYKYSRWDPLDPPPRPDWAEATILAAGLIEEQPERLVLAVLRRNPILAGECVHKSGVEIPSEVRTQVVRTQVLRRLEQLVSRPPAWINVSSWAARLGLGMGRRVLPESWRNWLQAWRLLPTSVRLGASRQAGYFEDAPAVTPRRGSLPQAGRDPLAFIEREWLSVPDGSFWMGSSPWDEIRLLLQRSQAFTDEKPRHLVTLGEYKIGRTPVTVAKYRCFMRAGGYQEQAWWPEGPARCWLQGELEFRNSYYYNYYVKERESRERQREAIAQRVARGEEHPGYLQGFDRQMSQTEKEMEAEWLRLEMQKRSPERQAVRPWLWDEPGYNHPAQPVVGICWYEAQAYIAWLDAILHQANSIPETWHVRLPSEAQWEKAARGTDARLYPWGNRWSLNYCNSMESRVQFPSPVGMYPHGASPCGALDMAGNVWEWCQDWYDPKEYEKRAAGEVRDSTGPSEPPEGMVRVVRGGSWGSSRSLARCAYRYRFEPDSFNDDLGFRVVLSPN